jgi:hypothetical protein
MNQRVTRSSTRHVLGILLTIAALTLGIWATLMKAADPDFHHVAGGGIVAAALAIFALLL